jgi:thioredoxin reductase (NADPH)
VTTCEVAVVGGGPAGLTAALFAARHGRTTVVLDPLGSGGAILNVTRVEDFPGFPDGVAGYELGPRLQQQALEAGAVFELGEARGVESHGAEWKVHTDSGELVAGALVVATGTRPSRLGVPREDELEGRGLSHCASCDGPLYQGQIVAVYGSGDHALIEALELVQLDVQVLLVSPEEALGGQETYLRRVAESPQVEIRNRTALAELLGDGRIDGVRLRDLESAEESSVPVAAVFAHNGRLPNTAFVEGILALDEDGHVRTDSRMRTERPGLFAAGDVRADSPGQAVAASADGAVAAVEAHRYLAERGRPADR